MYMAEFVFAFFNSMSIYSTSGVCFIHFYDYKHMLIVCYFIQLYASQMKDINPYLYERIYTLIYIIVRWTTFSRNRFLDRIVEERCVRKD